MSSNKFSFKSLFHRKKNKQEDDLDRYMKMHTASNSKSNQENERPGAKRTTNPLDIAPTACYHTEVAPRSRRGPKSCPGGVRDDEMDGGMNRSFETEVSRPRRRAASPDYGRENKRSSLANRGAAFSEFNGPVSRRRDLDYRSVVIKEDNEDGDVEELRSELRELRRRLAHTLARKSHYKEEYTNQQDIRKRTEKAYKAQEENYQKEIESLKEKNEMLAINNQNLRQSLQQRSTLCGPCSMRTPSFYQYPFMSMPPIPHHMSLGSTASSNSVIADPQPTRNDVCQYPQQMDFNREDKDETKVFTYESGSIADYSEYSQSHSQME